MKNTFYIHLQDTFLYYSITHLLLSYGHETMVKQTYELYKIHFTGRFEIA